ncbi:matrix metalloproteinase-2-like [Contarinia nasturtii]|uniref:matrix metalloproteinase-2-like n=1 Tax=Contarinia nasturtii TaxID=265458 RepID=UPI0012D3B1F5|nr:matrix metalloproteinase-2-like [Contarinia nasturtii]
MILLLYENISVFSVLISIFVLYINGHPINFSWEGNQANLTQIMGFMQKFGYLNSSARSSSIGGSTIDTLYHEDAIVAGIKNMQKFGSLNETGVLDEPTIKLLTSPRCGVADITKHSSVLNHSRAKRFILGSRGWMKRRLTYYIQNWSPKVGEDKVAEGMKKAFKLWSKYSNLQFVRVFESNADIIVSFGSRYHGDIYPFDGPGSVLAHAFFPYSLGSLGGDIHFDNDENWKENASNLNDGVDFTSVAIHELGHSLGLAHSPIFSSIMFPYYKGPEESKELGYDDILAMYELYIKNEHIINDIINDTTTEASTFTPKVETGSVSTPRKEPTTIPSRETTSSPECDNHHSVCKSFNPTRVPNLCDTLNFDTMALLRGEIFLFKNKYVWRLSEDFQVLPGYPTHLSDIFRNIPSNVRRIDAAYERKTDGAIILFGGHKYYIYDGYDLIENSPRPIIEFGFDNNINKVDAVMIWSKNSQTYLFSGNTFIRYNEERREKDVDYPKNLGEKWHGIPNNIDSAISMTDGKTYFFKGDLYWLYNNQKIQPEQGFPRRTSIDLFKCSDN